MKTLQGVKRSPKGDAHLDVVVVDATVLLCECANGDGDGHATASNKCLQYGFDRTDWFGQDQRGNFWRCPLIPGLALRM